MVAGKVPTHESLRVLLACQFKTDSDFNAFVLDHFENTFQQLSDGMQRQAKVTLLLSRESTGAVFAALCKQFPGQQEAFAMAVEWTTEAKGLPRRSVDSRKLYLVLGAIVADWLRRFFADAVTLLNKLGLGGVSATGLTAGGVVITIAVGTVAVLRSNKTPAEIAQADTAAAGRADSGGSSEGVPDLAGPRDMEFLADLADPANMRLVADLGHGPKEVRRPLGKNPSQKPPAPQPLPLKLTATAARPAMLPVRIPWTPQRGFEHRFLIAQQPITQMQYVLVMRKNPSNDRTSPDDFVSNISILEAMEFCNKISVRENLPSCYQIESDEII